MIKVKRLMILGLCLTSCSNPNNVINTNATPSPTNSSNTSVNPIPSISSSVTSSSPTPSSSISPMPSLIPTPTPTPTPSVYENPNAIKKVELYNKYGKLIESEQYKFTLSSYGYYDIKPYAKITYNEGRSEDKEVILESSNKEIAHIESNVLYIHSKDNKSGFNLIIRDKETTKEIASYKIELGLSGAIFEKNYPVMLSGKIYDTEGNNLKDTKISIKCLDPAVEYESKYILIEQPKYGEFKLDYILPGIRFEIEVSKEGYKTVTRKFVLKDSLFQEMNFGGTNEEDKPYALEKL
ncbi:MAG: hypothetical protein ACK4IX_14460 [Candidatus Sericytochromatia bacterium]